MAATRQPPRSSAGSSPNAPRRPVLTRFASTAEATSTTVGSKPLPGPLARRVCNSNAADWVAAGGDMTSVNGHVVDKWAAIAGRWQFTPTDARYGGPGGTRTRHPVGL